MALTIIQQESLFVENQIKDGQTEQVHYVVKNTPFQARLRVFGTPLNFNTSVLQCVLCYNLPERKEVEGVKGQPVEYLMHPSSDGKTCSLTLRVRVLSTQHHGINFLLRFRLSEGMNSLETVSEPIKTTSKLDPIRRKIAEQNGGKISSSKKKRARSDELLETLEEIREAQREQGKLISSFFTNFSPFPSVVNFPEIVTVKQEQPTLESSLKQLLSAFKQVEETERPQKLRRLITSLSPEEQGTLQQVGYVLSVFHEATDPPSSRCSTSSSSSSSLETLFQPTDSLDDSSSFSAEECLTLPYPSFPDTSSISYTPGCVHSKELELWNNAVHDLLAQDFDE